jgi:acyl-CoA thioester hydrolase
MTEFVITHRGTIYPWQCDHMGHMNVMWYVGKFDEASWQLLATLGLTASRFRSERIGMAAVEQHIEYKRELHAGDVITIQSTVLKVRNKSIRMQHEMINDQSGELAARMEVVGVHMETIIRKARSLPVDVRERADRLMRMNTGGAGSQSFLELAVEALGSESHCSLLEERRT